MSDNNGFVYVASVSDAFYKAAVRSANSLKDHYPNAKITLFTHKSFFRQSDKVFFDNVVFDIPVHTRAKMWGMARSPYEKTLYLDSDTEIRSEKISHVFDLLNKDIMFTKILPHVSKDTCIDNNNQLEYHGGVVLYNTNTTVDLLKDWYYNYIEQTNTKDWSKSKFSKYSDKMKPWDQFTIWYLLNSDKYKHITHGFFPNGGHEYNYIYLLESDNKVNDPYRDLEQIVYHYTLPKVSIDAGHIKYKSRAVGDFD